MKIKIILFLFLALLVFVNPDFSLAGTGGEELKDVYDKTLEVAEGNGARITALVTFIGSIIAAAVRGSLMPLIPGFGISVLIAVGPSIFTSGVSAII